MIHYVLTILVLVWLVLIFPADLRMFFPVAEPTQPAVKEAPAKTPRPLRPRAPDDCPAFRDMTLPPSRSAAAYLHVRPWSRVKSRLGRPKEFNTEGFACPIPDCDYHRLTDSTRHALVAYGYRGKSEPIQGLFCDACQHKFTVRRDTPLYRLKTSPQQVALALTALTEGLSVSSAVQVFGHAEGTITA
jgi:transposase-like protein